MNCDVIRDLIPLYIDGVCSDESRYAVETHLTKCESCKALYEAMSKPMESETAVRVIKKTHKIKLWRASILQSVLFLISFLAITVGVYFEAQTGIGDGNGEWARLLVVPFTGFLISLTSWYFVRLFKTRLSFSLSSAFFTLIAIFICGSVAVWHYSTYFLTALIGAGLVYHNVFVSSGLIIGSYLLAQLYSRLLGKE